MSETVGWPNDEVLKRVSGEQIRRVALLEGFVDALAGVVVEGPLIGPCLDWTGLGFRLGRNRDRDLKRLRPHGRSDLIDLMGVVVGDPCGVETVGGFKGEGVSLTENVKGFDPRLPLRRADYIAEAAVEKFDL